MESVKSLFDRLFQVLGMGFFQKLVVKPHPTLRFHRRFGKNIRVDESRSVALRTDDFQHGIVFTSRPVELNEIVCLKILKRNNQWKGPLCFGFTDIDPALLRTEELERARVLFRRYWRRFWFHGLYSSDCTFLTFALTETGEVKFRVDDEEFIIPRDEVHLNPRYQKWAVIDIYGSFTSVQLVYHPAFMRSGSFDSAMEYDSSLSVSESESMETDSDVSEEDYPAPVPRRSAAPRYFTFDIVNDPPNNAPSVMPTSCVSPLSASCVTSPTDFASPRFEPRSACVICLDQPSDTAVVDCGHMCICSLCARQLWEFEADNRGKNRSCPVCRKPISSFLRIY